MSSIEEDKERGELGQFFDDILAPMAERMKARGQEAFPLRPDPTCHSYYVPRGQPAMTPQDFTAPSCQDAADFEPRLAAHWKALGRTELLGVVSRVRDLAQAAQAARALVRDSGELPPDIYIMF